MDQDIKLSGKNDKLNGNRFDRADCIAERAGEQFRGVERLALYQFLYSRFSTKEREGLNQGQKERLRNFEHNIEDSYDLCERSCVLRLPTLLFAPGRHRDISGSVPLLL